MTDDEQEQPDWMQRERENELREQNSSDSATRSFWVEKSTVVRGKFVLYMDNKSIGNFDSIEEAKIWSEEFCHNQKRRWKWKG